MNKLQSANGVYENFVLQPRNMVQKLQAQYIGHVTIASQNNKIHRRLKGISSSLTLGKLQKIKGIPRKLMQPQKLTSTK